MAAQDDISGSAPEGIEDETTPEAGGRRAEGHDPERRGDGSRRGFLRALGTSTLASGLVLGATSTGQAQLPLKYRKGGLSGQLAASRAGRGGRGGNGRGGQGGQGGNNQNGGPGSGPSALAAPEGSTVYFPEVQADENAHVQVLLSVLGSMARPKPTFQNLTMSTVGQFLEVANSFEVTGVGAYLGAAPYINSQTYLGTAARIATVEARHATYFGVARSGGGIPLVPNGLPLDSPLSQAYILQLVMPFIASLNGGPPPAFDLTRSDANDIAILNFALVLEYLERDFYNINVPVYFGAGAGNGG